MIRIGQIVFTAFLLTSCMNSPVSRFSYPHNSALDYELPSQMLEALRHRALTGDGKAARNMSDHHFANNEIEDGIFWLRLSAEIGDCDSQKRLSDLYARRTDAVGHKFAERRRVDDGCDPTPHAELPPSK
jgi:hypothetical protein